MFAKLFGKNRVLTGVGVLLVLVLAAGGVWAHKHFAYRQAVDDARARQDKVNVLLAKEYAAAKKLISVCDLSLLGTGENACVRTGLTALAGKAKTLTGSAPGENTGLERLEKLTADKNKALEDLRGRMGQTKTVLRKDADVYIDSTLRPAVKDLRDLIAQAKTAPVADALRKQKLGAKIGEAERLISSVEARLKKIYRAEAADCFAGLSALGEELKQLTAAAAPAPGPDAAAGMPGANKPAAQAPAASAPAPVSAKRTGKTGGGRLSAVKTAPKNNGRKSPKITKSNDTSVEVDLRGVSGDFEICSNGNDLGTDNGSWSVCK